MIYLLLDWCMNVLHFLAVLTGVLTWAYLVGWMLDFRAQRRAWRADVARHRMAGAQERTPAGSLTLLHGATCRCILCCIEGKGKGDRRA